MQDKHSIYILPILLLIAALVYLPGANSPLYLDSVKLGQLEQIYKEKKTEISLSDIKFGKTVGRHVSQASFYANIALAEKLAPKEIKQVNIILHLLCGILVFLISAQILNLTSYKQKKYTIALLTTAFWLLSPLNVSTVLYAIQRMTQLSTFFTLITLSIYLAIREQSIRAPNTIKTASGVVCGLTFFYLAIQSKENAVLIPLYIILAEITLFKTKLTLKTTSFALALAVIGLIVLLNYSTLLNYENRPFTLSDRLITESVIVMEYIKQMLVPTNIEVGLFHDNHQVYQSLFDSPLVILSIVLITASIYFSTRLANHPSYNLYSFSVLFFLTGHLLESTIFPLELYFEHRNYTPSIGIFIGLATLVISAANKFSRKIHIATALYFLLFILISHLRIQTWQQPERAYYLSAFKEPPSGRALSSLTQLYLAQGNATKAHNTLDYLIAHIPERKFTGIIQKLYIHCLTETPIDDSQYTELSVATSHHSAIETSQSLHNLTNAIDATNCKNINRKKLVNSLTKQQQHPPLDVNARWHIDYYIAKILLLDSELEAITFLKNLEKQGNNAAGLYLNDILKAKQED